MHATRVSLRDPSARTPWRAMLLAGVALVAFARLPANAEMPSQGPLLLAMMDDMGMGGQQSQGAPMGGMPGSQIGGGMPSMGAQSGGAPGSMGGMGCCMGMMGQSPGSASGMAMPSAFPGFPGASHLYHVGATGFFLDYADKLGLTVEQRTALNDVKQRALLDQSGTQRKVEEAEQALWLLTAAEQPDAAAVEAKLREIEKAKADQRLAFIRAVGEAAKTLTMDQRKMVLGMGAMPTTAAKSPGK